MSTRWIDRGETRVAYHVSGDEKSPALLLGHSLFCDRRMWQGLVPRLSERFRVINIEARGHGGSNAPSRFTLEDLADDWLAILDKEKIDRALLCGLSMGGMTAMRLALAAPDRVLALAILDSSADEELPGWRRYEYRALAEILRTVGHVDLICQIARGKLVGRTTRKERPEVADRVVSWIKQQSPPALYNAVRAVFDRQSIHPRLGSITCPTLVLCGEEDVATIVPRSERIAAGIPGARLRLIPRAGHLSAYETPGAVADELLPFLLQI